MTYNYAYDVSRFLDASIDEVLHTLFEAFGLVFIIVFLFCRIGGLRSFVRWRCRSP
jgi:multidrug efflux pump subunit AcrB